MGSESGEPNETPVHRVAVSEFLISRCEITRNQYEVVTGGDPSHFRDSGDLPVESVNWYDAVRFCNRLSELSGFQPSYDLSTWRCDFTGEGFRLPTEAEWEYACRAGSTSDFYTGDGVNSLKRAGWYKDNSSGSTHPVGRRESNQFSLYDMHGNVSEWCHDLWAGRYSPEPAYDPAGPLLGSRRVIRGGSWANEASECRSSARVYYTPEAGASSIGIRVVRQP